MKLSTYAALIAGTTAIKLSQHSNIHLHKLLKIKTKSKQGGGGDPEGELAAWVESELANDGTITK